MLQGQSCPVTIKLVDTGADKFPLSSTARVINVRGPRRGGLTVKVQLSRPVAGCQVVPPSSENSTPATTPPESAAVPEMVLVVPACNPPETGLMDVTGATVSADLVAATRPGCNACGCTPISANRFTVACSILTSGNVPLMVVPRGLS